MTILECIRTHNWRDQIILILASCNKEAIGNPGSQAASISHLQGAEWPNLIISVFSESRSLEKISLGLFALIISSNTFLTSLRAKSNLTSRSQYLSGPDTEHRDGSRKGDASTPDDLGDTATSFQREQQRLTEELNTERRRSESLKATFTKSLSSASDRQREALGRLRMILEKEPNVSTIHEALKLLGDISDSPRAAPDSPHPSDLVQKAKEAEDAVRAQQTENQKPKQEIRALMTSKDELSQKLQDLQAQIEAQTRGRAELKERLKGMAATFKKREAEWK